MTDGNMTTENIFVSDNPICDKSALILTDEGVPETMYDALSCH